MEKVKIAVWKNFDTSGYDWYNAVVEPDHDTVALAPRTATGEWERYMGTREYALPEGLTLGIDQNDKPAICDGNWCCEVLALPNAYSWVIWLHGHNPEPTRIIDAPIALKMVRDEMQVYAIQTVRDNASKGMYNY